MEKNYFLVRLIGEYFIKSGTSNMLRSFNIELKLPRWQHCLSMARNHLLPALIGEKDMAYNGIRRCIVVDIKTKEGNDVEGLPFTLQNKEQLRRHVESNGININVDMYPDLIKLRKRVEFAKYNPDRFAKQEQGKQRSYASISEALSLNADVLDDIEETVPDIQASSKAQPSADTTASKPHQEPMPTDSSKDTTAPAKSSVPAAGADAEGQEDFDPHGEESESMFD